MNLLYSYFFCTLYTSSIGYGRDDSSTTTKNYRPLHVGQSRVQSLPKYSMVLFGSPPLPHRIGLNIQIRFQRVMSQIEENKCLLKFMIY